MISRFWPIPICYHIKKQSFPWLSPGHAEPGERWTWDVVVATPWRCDPTGTPGCLSTWKPWPRGKSRRDGGLMFFSSMDWFSRENLKPWDFPMKIMGSPVMFFLKPIHWVVFFKYVPTIVTVLSFLGLLNSYNYHVTARNSDLITT